VAELPEAPPAPQKDADELISQMAGKEVDRLLADAEIEREDTPGTGAQSEGARAISSPAGPLAADAAKTAGDEEALLSQQIEALISAEKGKPAQTTPESTAATAVEADAVQNGNESAAPSAANAAITPSPEPIEPAAQVKAKAAEAEQTNVTPDAAPKLADAAPASESPVESISIDPLESEREGARGVPIFLLPLDWLNRPFAFVTDAARDAMGKIAVLTSLNAAALFVYIIWFRHR